jgi:methionyl aminopeptidase
MDKDILDKYRKAGKIMREAKKYAKELVKEGMPVVQIADEVESKILSLGGKIGFPCNVSINEIAAHHVPLSNDSTILKKGDLVKVDIGVHIDGYITDSAVSFSVGKDKENEVLIKATEDALKEAIKHVKAGVKVSELGGIIQKEIVKHKVQVIKNLRGHLIDRWTIHAGLNIPNYDDGNETQVEEGMIIAIEPFSTNGEGIVVEGKTSGSFTLLKPEANMRSGRDILDHIKKEHNTLPFAKRWIVKQFGPVKAGLFLRELVTKGVGREYKTLREKANGKVAQTEHTLYVTKTGCEILT